MGERMDSGRVKKANREFIRHFPITQPSMGWYFSSAPPKDAITLPTDTWTCMFKYIDDIAKGNKICFSENSSGCPGASCYFGFSEPSEKAGGFLACKEKYKETVAYGNDFYHQIKAREPLKKYLILSNIDEIEDGIDIEVVNYWVTPLSLSGLVTLSNFDSSENNNVIIPFASGCQSMWTIPYKEKMKEFPKATIGAVDPAMRKYIASDTILFSVPATRFFSMANKINMSFACDNTWLDIIESSMA
jgi:hypothetical protein